MKAIITRWAALLSFALLATACSDDAATGASKEDASGASEKKTIVIGTTVGDFGDMVKEFIQPEMAKDGYTIKLVEFTDYVQPNRALAEGSIDINVFQHKPYLDAFKTSNNLDLVELFQVPTGPLGVYTGKGKSLDELGKRKLSFSVANDPSNFARTLMILDEMGIITLNEGIDQLKASKRDIKQFNYEVELIELEAAQIPRSRDDVDFAIIPGNYAASSGIPFTDALYTEGGFTFMNWATIKRSDLGKSWVEAVENAYNSDAFKAYAAKRFAGYKYPQIWDKD